MWQCRRQGDVLDDTLMADFGVVAATRLGGETESTQAKTIGFEHRHRSALIVDDFAFKLHTDAEVAGGFDANL